MRKQKKGGGGGGQELAGKAQDNSRFIAATI